VTKPNIRVQWHVQCDRSSEAVIVLSDVKLTHPTFSGISWDEFPNRGQLFAHLGGRVDGDIVNKCTVIVVRLTRRGPTAPSRTQFN